MGLAILLSAKPLYNTKHTGEALYCDFARVGNVTFYMICMENDEKAS